MEIFVKTSKMFQFVRKRTKFSNDKTIQLFIQLSLLGVMMFEMTNYTRDLLGTRLLRFGDFVPLAIRFVQHTDSNQSEQFFASATMFSCKLVRVLQLYVRIAGVEQRTLDSQILTVLLVQIANGRQECALINQILHMAFRAVMILPWLMGGL